MTAKKPARVTPMEKAWKRWIRLDNWHKMDRNQVHLLKIAFQGGFCKCLELEYDKAKKEREAERKAAMAAERRKK